MKLPENLRERLKAPLGILLRDTTKENILRHITDDSYVITVGDATTEKMLKFDIVPSLSIVDGLEKRKKEPSHKVPQQNCSVTILQGKSPRKASVP